VQEQKPARLNGRPQHSEHACLKPHAPNLRGPTRRVQQPPNFSSPAARRHHPVRKTTVSPNSDARPDRLMFYVDGRGCNKPRFRGVPWPGVCPKPQLPGFPTETHRFLPSRGVLLGSAGPQPPVRPRTRTGGPRPVSPFYIRRTRPSLPDGRRTPYVPKPPPYASLLSLETYKRPTFSLERGPPRPPPSPPIPSPV